MAALTQGTDRRVADGDNRNLPSASGAVPFEGSLLGLNAAGFYVPLTGGLPFGGVCTKTILAKDAATSNGQVFIQARTGIFRFVAVISGIAATDIVAGRAVYATTDNDLTLTAEAGATYIGKVVSLDNGYGSITNGVVVEAVTHHNTATGSVGNLGSAVLADANATLTTSQLDLYLEIGNTAARTLTLPAVAVCTGRTFRVKKTSAAAFAVTLQGNAAETIDGANTYATSTSQWAFAEIRSDGTQWLIIAKI